MNYYFGLFGIVFFWCRCGSRFLLGSYSFIISVGTVDFPIDFLLFLVIFHCDSITWSNVARDNEFRQWPPDFLADNTEDGTGSVVGVESNLRHILSCRLINDEFDVLFIQRLQQVSVRMEQSLSDEPGTQDGTVLASPRAVCRG